MFGWLTRPAKRRGYFPVAACGELTGGEPPGAANARYFWAAVPVAAAQPVTLPACADTFEQFVEVIVRVARNDPPFRPVLGRVIEELYAARDRHPGCEIFVIEVKKEGQPNGLRRLHLRDGLHLLPDVLRPAQLRLEGGDARPRVLRGRDFEGP